MALYAYTWQVRCTGITDLFSLYILFSQCRSCVVTLESCFFEISSYSRAYVRIIYEKTKGKYLWEHHMTFIVKTKCTS